MVPSGGDVAPSVLAPVFPTRPPVLRRFLACSCLHPPIVTRLCRLVVLITGASGFIGGAIAGRLVDRAEVRGLTSHPAKNRFGDRVRSFAYDFDDPARMAPAFQGVDVFVNSYYVRFNYGGLTFDDAVARSRVLIAKAREAGVRRIVHVSVSNARETSDLPYYANKARIE